MTRPTCRRARTPDCPPGTRSAENGSAYDRRRAAAPRGRRSRDHPSSAPVKMTKRPSCAPVRRIEQPDPSSQTRNIVTAARPPDAGIRVPRPRAAGVEDNLRTVRRPDRVALLTRIERQPRRRVVPARSITQISLLSGDPVVNATATRRSSGLRLKFANPPTSRDHSTRSCRRDRPTSTATAPAGRRASTPACPSSTPTSPACRRR